MKRSIQKRTFLFFSVSMVLIILVFSILFFQYFWRSMEIRLKNDQFRTTVSLAQSVDNMLMNIKQNAYFLCSNEKVAQMVVNRDGYNSLVQRDKIKSAFNASIGNLSSSLMHNSYAVLFLDQQFPISNSIQGNFSMKRLMTQRLYSSFDVQDTDWYQETINRINQVYAFWDEQSPQNVFFSQFLRSIHIADPKYNDKIGVVLYAVPKNVLEKILDNARITEGTTTLLLFEGSIFLSNTPELFPTGGGAEKSGEMAEFLSALPSNGETVSLSVFGKKYVVSAESFQGDWKAVILMPSSDIWKYVWNSLPMMIAVLILLLAASSLISFLLSRQLVQPIIRLSAAMVTVRDERNLPLPIPVPSSNDEIEVLYRSYNRMLEWIQRLMEEAVDEAEKLRQAQIQFMQAQINPHFLYNTLDSISCCALMEGNDDIVTMVASLISILKYSINFSRTMVPLREEIDYLRHYIQIQKLRYKNGFRFICDVPEKYGLIRIAPIILQPLVENALFHAQSYEEMLEIRLFCEETHEVLRIHVKDNGVEGDAKRLNNMLLSTESEKAKDGREIGIRNVNNRIRLLIGGDSGLHYEQDEKGGMDAIIQIPLDFRRDDT